MSETFVVYLTIYSGNKLPPFYIGYCRKSKVEKGYHGSVLSKIYKQIWIEELELNPGLFKTKILIELDTRAEAQEKEEKYQLHLQVHKNDLYINKTIGYRKFGSQKGMKHSRKRKPFSEEHRKKLSQAKLGQKLSVATKSKMRQTNIMKYGTQFAMSNDVVHQKVKDTNIQKYGVANVFSSSKIKQKIKATNLEKYGVENPSCLNDVKKKKRTTSLRNTGYGAPLENPVTREKIKLNLIEKYGVDHPNKIQVECPHCGKIGGKNNMNRYHFNNCYLLKNSFVIPY